MACFIFKPPLSIVTALIITSALNLYYTAADWSPSSSPVSSTTSSRPGRRRETGICFFSKQFPSFLFLAVGGAFLRYIIIVSIFVFLLIYFAQFYRDFAMAMSAALLALRKNAPFLLWSLKNAAGELGFPASQVCFLLLKCGYRKSPDMCFRDLANQLADCTELLKERLLLKMVRTL
jgi:hypothetical protein